MGKKQASQGTIRAEVVALAKGGDGIARTLVAGKRTTLFIAGTAPGDVVDVIVDQGPRARVVALVEPSPLRVVPPCAYANECGGCDWMHIQVDAQRTARQGIVQDALRRAGLDVTTIHAHDAARVDRYRGRVRLAVASSKGAVVVGMRAARSHRVVPVPSCLVLRAELDETRGAVAGWLEGSDGWGEASITLGSGGRPAVHLSWDGQLASSAFGGAQQRVNDGEWAGVSVQLAGATVPAVIGDARGVTVAVDGQALFIPPGGFMQAHEEMNHALVRHVAEVAGLRGRPAIELFSGAGNFTIALAPASDDLETVELDALAVEAARLNLERRGLHARTRVGDADQVKIGASVRVAVLDPPRTGAPGASSRLAQSKVRSVVMVSCDPATLARDSSILHREGGFELERVDVFEMFPHTSHVETVAVLRRQR